MLRFSNGFTREVVHAIGRPPEIASHPAGWYKALCGAAVRNATTVEWEPINGGGTHCRNCVKAVHRLNRKDAAWRNRPMTEDQVALARRLDIIVQDAWDSGMLSDAISTELLIREAKVHDISHK